MLPARYDDGGFSGGNMDRPALKRLLEDIPAKQISAGGYPGFKGFVFALGEQRVGPALDSERRDEGE